MWWRPDLFWEDSAQSDLGSLEVQAVGEVQDRGEMQGVERWPPLLQAEWGSGGWGLMGSSTQRTLTLWDWTHAFMPHMLPAAWACPGIRHILPSRVLRFRGGGRGAQELMGKHTAAR